jgi:endonuclease III related protein
MRKLTNIYGLLFKAFGPQRWGPAEGPFEVMVGAVLTQSAAWGNVEKAIFNLKRAGVLSPPRLRKIGREELAGLIHSCGYFNAKAAKLKSLADWFWESCRDDLNKMSAQNLGPLRERLLEVNGVGQETADSILLYANYRPVFVIDAYTCRIIDRLGLKPAGDKYADYQRLFMDNLKKDTAFFNEYHALLVALGKNICRKSSPRCRECPLSRICLYWTGLNQTPGIPKSQ